jgi:hypothetical protein
MNLTSESFFTETPFSRAATSSASLSVARLNT